MRTINTSTPTFGPGGNGDLFYAEGGKSTLQAPSWLKNYGLDAYEYEAGNGLTAGEASLRAVGEAAKEAGIQAQKQYLPITLVSDGKLLKSNLPLVKRDAAWVERVLKSKNATLSDTWLLTADMGGNIIFYRKDGSQ